MTGAPYDEGARSEDFDHHSEAFARDFLAFYRRAREASPIFESQAHGGFKVLTRYSDIRAVLRDHANFSSARFHGENGALIGGVAIPPNGARIGMIEMDPPEALQLRAILQPWFTREAVAAGARRIEEMARWVVDSVVERGACDVVADLAKPMPTLLILDMLGLPLDRAGAYGKVLHDAVAKASGSLPGLRWLLSDLEQLVRGEDYHPEGVIAAMRNAELDGAPLGVDLVCELTMMLLFGGSDTSIASISFAMLHLSAHKDVRARLARDRDKIPAFVEELLRFYSPPTGVARTVMRDIDVGAVTLKRGERVLCAVNSGNRDEAVFAHAERFDADRPAKPHLAFGAGVHACLGQNLARVELRIILTEILRRLGDFDVQEARVHPYATAPLVNGFSAMAMTFTPGPKLAPARAWPELTAPRIAPIR